jgi:hypothetical protein
MSRTFKVMFARFPGGNSEHPASSSWLMSTLLTAAADPRIGRENMVQFTRSDTPITMVRNLCVKEALSQGVDYLLMIDSDMQPDLPGEQPFWATAWEFMMQRRMQEDLSRSHFLKEHEEELYEDRGGLSAEFEADLARLLPPATICAPYCGPPPHENVYVFRWANRETGHPNPDFRLDQFTREEAAVRTGIEEAAALPTGLILYDMRVFKQLPPPWFRYEFGDAEESFKATTEDVYQTRNASLLGLPQMVAWQCWAGHVKSKTVLRPTLVTRDMVAESLRGALARPFDQGDRLMIVGQPDRPDPPTIHVVGPRGRSIKVPSGAQYTANHPEPVTNSWYSEIAEGVGLGHWTCVSTDSNESWRRDDGRYFRYGDFGRDWVDLLREEDQKYPMGVPANHNGRGEGGD